MGGVAAQLVAGLGQLDDASAAIGRVAGAVVGAVRRNVASTIGPACFAVLLAATARALGARYPVPGPGQRITPQSRWRPGRDGAIAAGGLRRR